MSTWSGLRKTPERSDNKKPGAFPAPDLLLLHRALAPLSASGFLLLFTLDAGLFIMLTLADLRQDAGARAFALETLQSAFQGLVFAHTNFRHTISPPSIEGSHGRTIRP